MSGRFVGVKPERLLLLMRKHQLDPTERWVFLCLILEADHTTGLWHGTQADLADVAGLDRRNIRARLQRLDDAGLIECYFPRGHKGRVKVRTYVDVVHLGPSQGTNHPLRDDMTPDRNGTNVRDGHKGRTIPIHGTNRPLWDRESPGHGVDASCLVERPALAEPFAVGGRSDEDADRAREAVAQVIDFPVKRRSSSPKGSTRGVRGVAPPLPDASPSASRAALAGEPHPLDASLPRVSAGGRNDPAPVHPRSRNDIPSSLAADVSHLRDPRAVGDR